MATDTIVSLFPQSKKPRLTNAQKQKNYRLRQKAKQTAVALPVPVTPAVTPTVTAPVAVTVSRVTEIVTAPRRSLASMFLTVAAFALAGVGITMNGWFARSLGSSDIAGWLFLAIGVAADAVALVIPACAAALWYAGRRSVALAGWTTWLMTFIFAVTAGIGFASLNISDVTLQRANRVTPAVTAAETALNDATVARDRECKSGAGKFCRQREQTVVDQRAAFDKARAEVASVADPQTEAAKNIVAWLTGGFVKPSSNDFAMLRLVLLALLPQIGGILLMVGRAK